MYSRPRPARRLRLLRAAWIIVLITLLAGTPFPSALAGPALPAPGASQKLLIEATDTAALAAVVAAGGSLLADYGTFSLWLLPAAGGLAQPDSAASLSAAAVPADFDTIYLRGDAVIDTAAGPSATAEAVSAAGEGFWLVQFVGPVLDKWLDELRMLDLAVVAYMPNNAYVVWGQPANIAKLQSAVAAGPPYQWSGSYAPAIRLAPS
ncbi:MAG: hypothetical protein HGA45_33120, partial [Chloroflexales bacterium]|nr:hypothetical protein [Chloroflexales bacterium]